MTKRQVGILEPAPHDGAGGIHMSFFKRALTGLFLVLLAAAAWAQQPASATVPISGQYYESGAGGWVHYAGTVTFDWAPVSDDGSGPFVRVSMVAHAWCLDTGAGYTFYGISTDSVRGLDGSLQDMARPFVAVGADDRPAFQGMLVVHLDLRGAAQTPDVKSVTIASR
jgi:hypothetical protein